MASGACHDNFARTIEIWEYSLLPSPRPLMEYELVFSLSVLSQYRKNCSTIIILFRFLGLAMCKKHYTDIRSLLFFISIYHQVIPLTDKG